MQLVFLLAFPRSGSTLLQCLLATHPQIHTRPEDCTLATILRTGGRIDQWQQRYIPERHRSGDGCWLEKDVMLFRQLGKLMESFPDAKRVWLRREPINCISSYWLMCQSSPNQPTIQELVERWQVFDAARLQLGGCTVQYEDLVADPLAELAKVEDYLELPPGCSIDPVSFDSRLALKAKVPHPEVLGAIAPMPSKVNQLNEGIRLELEAMI